jgi:hypothetical protein
MAHPGQKQIGTMALVGAAVAAVLCAVPARAQDATSLDCRVAPTIQSVQSTTPTTLEFVNQTLGGTVIVSWIDFQGKEQTYGTLPPGQSVVQQTFLNHAWKVTAANGACLGIYLATAQPTRVVIRPDDLPPFNCAQAPLARSREGKMSTTIEFVNQSLATLVISWIDYQGKAQAYATLQPGQSVVQQTFLTHPWKVTAAVNGMCLGIYLPTLRPGRVVVVPAG